MSGVTLEGPAEDAFPLLKELRREANVKGTLYVIIRHAPLSQTVQNELDAYPESEFFCKVSSGSSLQMMHRTKSVTLAGKRDPLLRWNECFAFSVAKTDKTASVNLHLFAVDQFRRERRIAAGKLKLYDALPDFFNQKRNWISKEISLSHHGDDLTSAVLVDLYFDPLPVLPTYARRVVASACMGSAGWFFIIARSATWGPIPHMEGTNVSDRHGAASGVGTCMLLGAFCSILSCLFQFSVSQINRTRVDEDDRTPSDRPILRLEQSRMFSWEVHYSIRSVSCTPLRHALKLGSYALSSSSLLMALMSFLLQWQLQSLQEILSSTGFLLVLVAFMLHSFAGVAMATTDYDERAKTVFMQLAERKLQTWQKSHQNLQRSGTQEMERQRSSILIERVRYVWTFVTPVRVADLLKCHCCKRRQNPSFGERLMSEEF